MDALGPRSAFKMGAMVSDLLSGTHGFGDDVVFLDLVAD
jgi:hypothetical protein